MIGHSYNSMCTKLISRSLWLEVVDELNWDKNHTIVYAEDMVCTVFLYRRARVYKSFLGTHYNYLQRSDSTSNTKDADRVEASIHSFEWVLNEIDPIIQAYSGRNELQKFLSREVKWGIEYLAEQSVAGVSKTSQEKLDSIQVRYLEALSESGSD